MENRMQEILLLDATDRERSKQRNKFLQSTEWIYEH
jgi:putative N-acetylmannosamine-6-phosphate epimerase